jgi:predicted transcriptional regulator
MTIKEIAELCGVKEQTVLNWAHKLEVLNQNIWLRISEKLKQGPPEVPSDYTLDETLAIIGEGGKNKALASLLAETATFKNALVVQTEAMAKIDKLPKLLEEVEKNFAEFEKEIMESHKRIAAKLDVAEMLTKGKGWPYPNFLGGSLRTN